MSARTDTDTGTGTGTGTGGSTGSGSAPPEAGAGSGASGPAGALLRLLREHAEDGDGGGAADFPPVGAEPGQVADALAIRALLAAHRRRAAALSGLYETAGDLASLRDLEAVLQAIVRRARTLVGTDVAYLLLSDAEAGDTYVRVTDGITTDAFKTGRLAVGTGLGGLVAATAQPYHTADYANDPRFAHSDYVDGVITAEGLVAIQGVPLKFGDQVYGVLFVANRRMRPFLPDEVDLLISLARHAALAIENATLFEEVRKAAAVHERLTAVALEGRGADGLAQAVADVLGGSVLFLDAHDRPLASAGGAPPEPLAWAAESAAVRAGRASLSRGDTCLAPVVAAGEYLGTLFLVRAGLHASDLHALERAAQAAALMLLGERSVAEAELRLRGEILDDLLGAPHRDPEGLRRRAALVGLGLDEAHVVLAARAPHPEHRRRVTELAGAHAARLGGIAGEYGGDTVVVLPGAHAPGPAARDLAETLAGGPGGTGATVGAEAAAPGAAGLVEAHRDATRCLDVLLTLGRAGEGASRDELGIHGVLLGQADRTELDRFVTRTVGPLLAHDADRGSELARTALAYFAHDGSLARTAAALYIHVNTLYQRIDRIAALIGQDWRHGDRALHVHLALKLRLTSG
ncbi:helix-turn-helix domain-containing protein [Streptomyces sp. NPDC090025]|uniref:helix-turn-helix domain-containing protein n=1 Tax=Streptomyces sp. NPDC090025 TaxID=3365922 RepID=UPI003836E68E